MRSLLSGFGKGDCVEVGFLIEIVNLKDDGHVKYFDSSRPTY
jgi:hypothetical protein